MTHAELQSFYASTRGLRSVPYIIFSNTAMVDACALHLSYLVVSHDKPRQLLIRVPPAKAGPPAQQLLAYHEEVRCQGIIYHPNTDIGHAGLKILELSEALRMKIAEELAQEGLSTPTPTQSSFPVNGTTRRVSEAHVNSVAGVAPNRRRSTPAIANSQRRGQDDARLTSIELEKARHRVQGDTLRDVGQQSNDLWRASLEMLSLSRTICLTLRPERQERPQYQAKYLEGVRPTTSPERPTRSKHSDDDFNFPALPNPLSKPLKPFTTSTALTPTNPNQPLSRKFHHIQKDNFTFLTPIYTPAPLPSPIPVLCLPPPSRPEPIIQNTYRSSLTLGFSSEVWRKILATAAGADGIMSESQQRSVLGWGMDRGTLSRERDSLGLADHAQIWRVLEATGCLAYDLGA